MAVSNAGYIATSVTARVVVTLPPTPAVGDRVIVTGSGAAGWEIDANTGQAVDGESLPRTWRPVSIGSPMEMATCLAGSADLERLVVGTAGASANAWLSSNAGLNWFPKAGNFFCAALSADGLKVALASDPTVAGDGAIYTSLDGGTTLTPQSGSPTGPYRTLLSSADGTRLVAQLLSGALYVSTDSGVTWTDRGPAGESALSISMSSDGMRLNLSVNLSGFGPRFYSSEDGGLSWTGQPGLSNLVRLKSQGCSADGRTILGGASGNQIWRSVNGGVTWAELPDSPYDAVCVAVSADGSRVAAQDAFGVPYTSADGGESWTAQPLSLIPPTLASGTAPTIATASQTLVISSDGSRLAALIEPPADGGAWVATSELRNLGLRGSGSQSATLVYVGGGRWVPLATSFGVITF